MVHLEKHVLAGKLTKISPLNILFWVVSFSVTVSLFKDVDFTFKANIFFSDFLTNEQRKRTNTLLTYPLLTGKDRTRCG